jgi:hypothetical protein
MSRDDWFRNESWNADIQAAFDAKLRRAHDKTQRLRIQAIHLIKTHPDVALALIDRYFDQGGDTSSALAHETRAVAYVVMGKIAEAEISPRGGLGGIGKRCLRSSAHCFIAGKA